MANDINDVKEAKMWAEMLATLEDKWRANQVLMDVWHGVVDEERQLRYFETSRAAWTVHLPATFAKLEVSMRGAYALGDDPVCDTRHCVANASPLPTATSSPGLRVSWACAEAGQYRRP